MTTDIQPPRPEDATAAVGRATGLMTVTIFLSRVTGYLRIFALAYAIGLFGTLPNAYNLANVMPNMIFELIAGGVLSSVMIPIITQHLVSGEKKDAWRIASTITNLAVIVLGVIVVLAILFPSPFVYTQTFINHDKAPVDLITFFFRIFVPQIIFYAIAAIFNAILFSHKRFVASTIAPVLNNLTVIATVMIFFKPAFAASPSLGLWVLALGTTLGVVVMALVQLPSVIQLGYRYQAVLNLSHPSIRRLGLLSLPVLGYVALNQVGLAVMNSIAINFDGGVAAYQYALPLFQITYGLLSYPISNALFPNLSAHAAKDDMESFRKDLSLGVRTIGFLLLPSTLVVFALSLPLVRLLLEHGAFAADAGASFLTAGMLQGMALGIFSFSLWMFVTKVSYAVHDTMTPTLVNAVGVALNITANLILVQFVGVIGIAYGFTLAYFTTSTLLLVLLRRKLRHIEGRAILSSLVPQTLASAAAAGTAYLTALGVESFLPISLITTQILQVGLSLFAAALVYLTLARLRNFPELSFMATVVPGFSRLMRLPAETG